MVHQPLKPPLRQTLEAYPGLTPRPELDTPSCQILENIWETVPQFRACSLKTPFFEVAAVPPDKACFRVGRTQLSPQVCARYTTFVSDGETARRQRHCEIHSGNVRSRSFKVTAVNVNRKIAISD